MPRDWSAVADSKTCGVRRWNTAGIEPLLHPAPRSRYQIEIDLVASAPMVDSGCVVTGALVGKEALPKDIEEE